MVSTICRQHQFVKHEFRFNLIPNLKLQVLQVSQERLSKGAFLTRAPMGALISVAPPSKGLTA